MSGIKFKPLCEKPKRNVFCGPDKYLTINKLVLREKMYPIIEDDSYFVFVKRGKGQFIINGVVFNVVPGCVCWIQCTHVLTIEPELNDEMEIWTCVYDYQLSNYLMFRMVTKNVEKAVVYGRPVIGPEGKKLDRIWELFNEFRGINSRRDYGSSLIKVSILGQLATLFAYEAEVCGAAYDSQRWPLGWRASMYIAAHSSDTLEAGEMTKIMRVDIPRLNREMRMVTGQSYDQMLGRCRCIMGASYFLYENLPFDYIAVHSGFKSEVTFYRNFKKTMGMTPSEYRDYMTNTTSKGIYRGMIMDETLISVISYLAKNIAEPVSLDGMAKALFTSGSIIRSLMYNEFGIGYKEVLSLFRIRCSESMLSATDMPIVDVSVMVGFNSDRTFSRVFSEINGMSPSEYRKLCRERR